MRDSYPLVSIVTTSFNSGKTIKQTIESILAQTYKNIEYLIIDGKSSDNTLDIAESYKDEFEAAGIVYRITSEKDQGIYDGMNKGISKASGVIIGIVNSDDWLEPDAIETVVDKYLKTNFDILLGDINIIKNESVYFIKRAKIRFYKTSRDLCHPGMFVTKQTYNEIGCYDESFWYADFDFWLRAFRTKREVVLANKVLSNYRLGGVSTKKKNLKDMLIRVREKYNCYRNNKYSPMYYFECFFMEFGKYLYAKFF